MTVGFHCPVSGVMSHLGKGGGRGRGREGGKGGGREGGREEEERGRQGGRGRRTEAGGERALVKAFPFPYDVRLHSQAYLVFFSLSPSPPQGLKTSRNFL